jgi:hypothetical protein
MIRDSITPRDRLSPHRESRLLAFLLVVIAAVLLVVVS